MIFQYVTTKLLSNLYVYVLDMIEMYSADYVYKLYKLRCSIKTSLSQVHVGHSKG